MDISITGKHLELTDPIKEYARKKILSLEKYFRRDGDWANAVLSAERGQFYIEVTIGGTGSGTVMYAHALTPDMYASIDAVREKLEKQVKKYKDKMKNEKKRRSRLDANIVRNKMLEGDVSEDYAAAGEDAAPDDIVMKKIPMSKPMTVQEAKAQLDLDGNVFLAFHNVENYKVNIIYKRKDGRYGLLEP